MKHLLRLVLAATLLCICAFGQAAQPSQPAVAGDVYHVHFNKAALGKAAELGQRLSTPDPKAPMPGHFIVLRHQEGDDWDYCVIEHLGTKATVDTSAPMMPAAARDQSAWHGDTFVSGPPWAEFAKAMGIDSTAKGGTPIYNVGVFRAAPGHRDQLQQMLGQAATTKVPTGTVMLTHLEGAPWNFMVVTRFNSWQDLATDRSAPANPDAWNQTREHVSFHHDTLADRIAPK